MPPLVAGALTPTVPPLLPNVLSAPVTSTSMRLPPLMPQAPTPTYSPLLPNLLPTPKARGFLLLWHRLRHLLFPPFFLLFIRFCYRSKHEPTAASSSGLYFSPSPPSCRRTPLHWIRPQFPASSPNFSRCRYRSLFPSLSPISPPSADRQIDSSKFAVTLKITAHNHSRTLSFSEFTFAFIRYS